MNRTHSTSPLSRPRVLTFALAGLLASSVGLSWAQGYGGSTGAQVTQPGTGARTASEKARIARVDRKFIEDAAASGQMEVQAAQLAATRATDPSVKDYASMVADHHASANSELMQLAASLGLELPAALPRAMRNEVEKLGKRSGAEFDREFVREIGIKEHERDIKRFQKASKDVKEPQLKAWIDKTLPTLEQHLAAAQKMPQAGSEAAASTRTQQQRMGAGANPPGAAPGTPPSTPNGQNTPSR